MRPDGLTSTLTFHLLIMETIYMTNLSPHADGRFQQQDLETGHFPEKKKTPLMLLLICSLAHFASVLRVCSAKVWLPGSLGCKHLALVKGNVAVKEANPMIQNCTELFNSQTNYVCTETCTFDANGLLRFFYLRRFKTFVMFCQASPFIIITAAYCNHILI